MRRRPEHVRLAVLAAARAVAEMARREELLNAGPDARTLLGMLSDQELVMYQAIGGTLTPRQRRRLGEMDLGLLSMDPCPAWRHGYSYRRHEEKA